MRTPLALLGLTLGLVAGLALLAPVTFHARCAISAGDALVLLTTRVKSGRVALHARG